MKIVYFFCLLIIGSFNTVAQELNFEDLIYIYSNIENKEKNHSYLSQRNFYYDCSYGDMHIYTLKGIPYLRSKTYVFTMEKSVSFVTIKESTFDYYKNIAEALGMKLEESKTRMMEGIELDYSNNKYSMSLIKDCVKVTRGKCEYNYQIILMMY